MLRIKIGRSSRRVVAAALGAALVVTVAGGHHSPGGSAAQNDNGVVTVANERELDCSQTESEYHGKGYIYLYSREDCKGAHGERDNSEADKDHGDKEGQIQEWDNNADSIVNTTSWHIEFYNYPHYNETPEGKANGDRFCLGPGEWINALQYYGDASGTKDWWRNSISSHRRVSAADCTRWFGWGHAK
jgi:hypothetical protein